MTEKEVTFYGADSDLDDLSQILFDAGFEAYFANTIRASENRPPRSISFVEKIGMGKVIKDYLTSRRKVMVRREDFGEEIIIKGNFSAADIERLMRIPHNLDIKDAPKELPEAEGLLKKMGTEVGKGAMNELGKRLMGGLILVVIAAVVFVVAWAKGWILSKHH